MAIHDDRESCFARFEPESYTGSRRRDEILKLLRPHDFSYRSDVAVSKCFLLCLPAVVQVAHCLSRKHPPKHIERVLEERP
jgi:hypothetical protein